MHESKQKGEIILSFECIKNCGRCCGVFPIEKELFEKNAEKLQSNLVNSLTIGNKIIAETTDGLCPFLKPDKSCAIYNDRPSVCKEFGLIERIPCPFLKINGNMRSEAQTKRVLRVEGHKLDDFLRSYEGWRHSQIENKRGVL